MELINKIYLKNYWQNAGDYITKTHSSVGTKS